MAQATEESQEQVLQDKSEDPQKQYEYKTTIIFTDKINETIISISPPSISPARMLSFVLRDRLRVRNLDLIKGWDTEQLGEITPNKIILSEK